MGSEMCIRDRVQFNDKSDFTFDLDIDIKTRADCVQFNDKSDFTFDLDIDIKTRADCDNGVDVDHLQGCLN